MKYKLFLLTTILTLITVIIRGQVPQTISYQGVLTDENGTVAADGSYNLSFNLYDALTGGTALWTENHNVAVSNGIFNIILGSINVLSLAFDMQYWLGVTVEGGTELSPRIQLTSSPYSLTTASISDGTVTTNKIVDGAVTQIKIPTGQVVKSINSLKDDVTFAAGSNVSITPSGNTLTISSSGGTGGGDITAVIAGTGLSGGGTTGDVTLNVDIPLQLEGDENDPWSIIYANNDGTGFGILGKSNKGIGVQGYNVNSGNYGDVGSDDYGVYGEAFLGGSGYIGSTNYGVYGKMAGATEGYFGSNNYGAYGKHLTSNSYGYLGGDGYGVYGGVTQGLLNFGVKGEHEQMGHWGILGSADYGVRGRHNGGNFGDLGTNSYGAYGFSTAQFGVWGESTTGQGIHGKSNTNNGVFGESTDFGGVYGSSTNSWGVEAINTGSTNMGLLGGVNNAIYGFTNNVGQRALLVVSNGGTGEAAYLQGSATVTGTLFKGGGAFKIDHPLDPANKYLLHSFVESPDMMNVYNGNATLNGNGEVVVELPEWFEALNKDFRYQLTCIGGFAPVYVASEVSGNQFKIAGGTPGLKVSWQVTGIRHDKFADAHRIPLEEYKEGKERGKYLHPVENGMSESYGINYEENQKIIQEQLKRVEQSNKLKAEAEQNNSIHQEK